MNHGSTSVDYETLDAAKRSALSSAGRTPTSSALRDNVSVDESRGESAFVFRSGASNMATVLECLGTKSTIARECQDRLGVNHFDSIGYDSVAAIVNDLICVGAMPLVVNAYFATGSPDWYGVEGRFEALCIGWARACRDADATWGGGESPELSSIITPTEIDLAGSAVGRIPDGVEPILGADLADGDDIVFVASSGLHANGSTAVRKVASMLDDGYATLLPSGETLGAAVLRPTAMYVALVEALVHQRVPISYLGHMTGHGLRKVMRPNREFTYRIDRLPSVPEVFAFLIEHLDQSPADAYAMFNMGVGFAVYCRPECTDDVLAIASSLGYDAWRSGTVEDGPRRVVLEPVNVTFESDSLQLR